MGWLLGLHPAHRQWLQRTPLALALGPRLGWWLSGFGSGQRPELQAQRRGLGEQDHPGAQAPEPDSQTHLCSPGLAPLSAVGFVPGSGPRGRAETLLQAGPPSPTTPVATPLWTPLGRRIFLAHGTPVALSDTRQQLCFWYLGQGVSGMSRLAQSRDAPFPGRAGPELGCCVPEAPPDLYSGGTGVPGPLCDGSHGWLCDRWVGTPAGFQLLLRGWGLGRRLSSGGEALCGGRGRPSVGI